MDLNEIFETSQAIVDFDTDNQKLIDNSAFIMSWGIARQKSLQTMQLINALLLMKKKYNISDLDFELFLENFDEQSLFDSE